MPQAYSESQIASLALKSLGDVGIASLADNTPAAAFMADLYPIARDALLRMYPWKFAIRRADLTKLTTAPLSMLERPDLPTTNAFALPSDFVRDLETGSDPNAYKYENVVTNTATGAAQVCIVSDNDTLKLRYIARITDTTQFDPLFAFALISMLAMEAALPITGSSVKLKAMSDLFQAKVQMARTAASFEGSEDSMVSSALIDVR